MIINNIDMTSLIDLTFLLLITFIITMPALEQGISIRLPHGKTDSLPSKKANIVTLDAQGKIFLNNRTISLDDLEKTLGNLAAARARRRTS
jgi:biopolymer transport protein ExbD